MLTLPHAIDVAADGRPVWAPVDVVEAQANVKLVAMAALDEHVYQMVSLTNPAAYPLRRGACAATAAARTSAIRS